jgi:glycosyltransferase involved in cell wall biosynthesis
MSMHKQAFSKIDGPPLVSVATTAFNSEKWLARALDSVLLQQTNFPIEIVIGDDCSTDGTLAVARSYQERNPQLIRVLERNKNVGMQRNYYETFEQCRGKYIAWLDADDCWTDPQKLAIQVQVLESNPSVSVCGHFVRQVTHDREVVRKRIPSVPPGRYGLKEIILQNFVPSPAIMFRNGIHRGLPKSFFNLTGLADWPILVVAGLSGDIVLLDRAMADYVLTPGSSYMSKDVLHQEAIDLEFCEQMESILPSEWHRYARASRGRRYESIAYLLREKGDFPASREAALKAFRSPALIDNCVSKIKGLLIAVACETKWKFQRGRAAS